MTESYVYKEKSFTTRYLWTIHFQSIFNLSLLTITFSEGDSNSTLHSAGWKNIKDFEKLQE